MNPVIYSTVGNVLKNGKIYVPTILVEALGWEENDVFEIYPEPDRILFEAVEFKLKPEHMGYVMTPKEQE